MFFVDYLSLLFMISQTVGITISKCFVWLTKYCELHDFKLVIFAGKSLH